MELLAKMATSLQLVYLRRFWKEEEEEEDGGGNNRYNIFKRYKCVCVCLYMIIPLFPFSLSLPLLPLSLLIPLSLPLSPFPLSLPSLPSLGINYCSILHSFFPLTPLLIVQYSHSLYSLATPPLITPMRRTSSLQLKSSKRALRQT